jgi:protein gp37
MQLRWVESIRKQCEDAGASFFFKQWGGVRKHRTGRTLNGQLYDAMPALAQVKLTEYVQIAV